MSSPLINLLLIEDDHRLAQLTSDYLQRNGCVVTVVHDGEQGLREAQRHPYDLLLLDIMLPGRSGLEVCRALRASTDLPIILLTARGEEADRVLGLELGADDYLVKPFSPRELLARMQALLRRVRGQAGPASKVLRVGNLVIDPGARRVLMENQEVHLTSYEFTLLRVLAERPGRVLSRERLMELALGNAEDSFDRSIDVHVSRLRQKLGDDPKRPRWIKTVRGAGYLLASGEDEP